MFAGLSHLLAAWFLVLAGIFTQFSMPFDINPVCVSSFQNFSRGNLHFTSAWITVVSVALLVAALLNAHRLKCISPVVCQKLQVGKRSEALASMDFASAEPVPNL